MKNRFWYTVCMRSVLFLFIVLGVACNACVVRADSGEGSNEDDPFALKAEQSLAQKRDLAPVIELKQRVESFRPKPALPADKVQINKVEVKGSTIIAPEAVNKLQNMYSGKMLNGKEMQLIADKITRAYSRHGYITSYAYIVSEQLAQGTLEIAVVEGKTGTITIQGNKNFSTELLMKKLTLKEGDLFNFITLNLDVFRMNKHQDRKAKLSLDPVDEGRRTNIVVEVKDKLPLHATLQADNYGSESILYNRYKLFLTHNNISGHDDSLTAKVELSDGDAHKIYDLDYIVPLNNTWKFEFYILPYKVEDYYYSDNEDTDFEKRARKFYFWFYQSLISTPNCELVSSYGFTYFDIFWYKPYREYDNQTRQDMFRIFKWDLSLNKADKYGRWVITNDLQKAVPDLWGGASVKSDASSVVGAKGDYVKNMFTVARRQKLNREIDFIGKARWQMSSATLTGVNAFSAGGTCGVIDNRGFPRTQSPADEGRALSLGFNFPAYGIPKNVKVPYSSTKLYDSMKLFTFWDWSQSILKSPKLAVSANDPNDKKITTLQSVGLGMTFALPDRNLSARVDCGFPLSKQTPKDGDHTHIWWTVTKGF